MSIAISVVLPPSRIVLSCTILFSFLLLFIGIYTSALKDLSILSRVALMMICSFAVWRVFVYHKKIAKLSWRINIDGQGQLRCHSNVCSNSFQSLSSSAKVSQYHLEGGKPLKLMAGTTLWTRMLFLRLQDTKESTIIHLIILPDDLSKDEFRRLSVACRWIVGHA
ncbi:MAG: flagellar hook-length control protein [Solimicrobium sp.]|nr:flagellar hook-length control protein [Solimicrobium sp.]